MNFTKLCLLSLILLATASTYAQKKETRDYKYGKITPDEFNIQLTGVDSAASAVTLFDIGKGWFEMTAGSGLVYVFERHTRYKIFDKKGYDLANLNIRVYDDNYNKTTLDYMDAATYNMENNKMVVSKINKDSRFSEKLADNASLKKFTLPNVKEGSIIEYKYKIKSDFIFNLRPWSFQNKIPVMYSSYRVKVPEYFKFKPTASGFIYLNPRSETINDSFLIDGKVLNFTSQNLQYDAENVPAMKDENFIGTMDDYLSKIEFELSSTSFPGDYRKNITRTWPDIIKTLKSDDNFGGFVKNRSYYKTLLTQIIKTESNPDTVLRLVFNYVKNNIKWNEEFSSYSSAGNSKSIFDKKAGNSADINLTLYGLLNETKIDVSPVLLSTRFNGKHPGIALLSKFNNVIISAKIGENTLLLDATRKNLAPGLLSYENLNHNGFKIDLEVGNGEWISLEDNKLSRENSHLALTLDENNKFTGTLNVTSTNHLALKRRSRYQSASSETDFIKDRETANPGLKIKNYKIYSLDTPEEPLIESMDISIEDQVEEGGNLLYFTPLLFEQTKENPFKLEERKFPVDFGYPFEENYRLTLEIPKGYKLESTPKNEKIILPEEHASFTFIFVNEDNKLQLSSRISVRKAVFTPEDYHGLKALFMNIVRKQAEKIVLKKI